LFEAIKNGESFAVYKNSDENTWALSMMMAALRA